MTRPKGDRERMVMRSLSPFFECLFPCGPCLFPEGRAVLPGPAAYLQHIVFLRRVQAVFPLHAGEAAVLKRVLHLRRAGSPSPRRPRRPAGSFWWQSRSGQTVVRKPLLRHNRSAEGPDPSVPRRGGKKPPSRQEMSFGRTPRNPQVCERQTASYPHPPNRCAA